MICFIHMIVCCLVNLKVIFVNRCGKFETGKCDCIIICGCVGWFANKYSKMILKNCVLERVSKDMCHMCCSWQTLDFFLPLFISCLYVVQVVDTMSSICVR